MLEYIILGILCDTSCTGYDLRGCIEQGIGLFYKASYGSLYPLLKKLLDRGLLALECEMQGKRERKIYHITPEGRKEFADWLEQSDVSEDSTEAFMAKVYFFDQLPDNIRKSKIQIYESRLVEYLNGLMMKKKYYEKLENPQNFYFKLSTLYFGICKLQRMILWCQKVEKQKDLEELLAVHGEEETNAENRMD